MSGEGFQGALDTRASLTIGPVTFFDDGEIRVREGTAPTEIATLVLAAVKDSQDKAVEKALAEPPPTKTWTLKQIFGAWQSAMEARHPMAVLDPTELTEDWRAFQKRLTRAEDPKR